MAKAKYGGNRLIFSLNSTHRKIMNDRFPNYSVYMVETSIISESKQKQQ